MEDVLNGIELLKNAESALLKNYDMLTDDFMEVCEMNEKLKHELAELKDELAELKVGFVKVSEMNKELNQEVAELKGVKEDLEETSEIFDALLKFGKQNF